MKINNCSYFGLNEKIYSKAIHNVCYDSKIKKIYIDHESYKVEGSAKELYNIFKTPLIIIKTNDDS